MDATAATIADNAFTLAMDDASWHGLGFPRRPPRNWLSEGLKPRWRREFEGRVHRQLLVIFAAAQVAGLGVERISVLYDVVEVLFGDGDDAFSRLIFPTKAAYLDALQDFVTRPAGEWYGIMLKRLAVNEIADEKLRAAVVVKSVFFMQTVERIRFQTSAYGVVIADWPAAPSFNNLVDEVYAAAPSRRATAG